MPLLHENEINFASQDRTIINNIITTITTNNDSYCLPSEEEQTSTRCSAKEAGSLRDDIPETSQLPHLTSQIALEGKTETIIDSTLPDNWDYVKLDLFNNATIDDLKRNRNKFKLAISIKVKGSDNWQ